uniref:Heparin sulfate O-sulfotransferase n=1 Tax=Timema genevievae TaxID=629358 RepID=A0A7R9JRF4_TIMGE|nr:unnamed protein product [Timema genevievae]
MLLSYLWQRQRLWLLVVVFICLLFMYYFEMKVSYLEDSKQNLELAVVRMQLREVELRRSLKTPPSDVDPDRDLVVVYNRVPKTGSTSLVGVAYDLCKLNNFHVLHLNITGNMHVLSLANQLRFVQNVTRWTSIKPAFYHGHVAFVDFGKFGAPQPLYVNLIRKPLDRLVSYYYFLRYGDNFRPHLVRRKHGDKVTFDECVEQGQPDCDPANMWLQVPFLCGHNPHCWEVASDWALEQAKRNLLDKYFLVGVTEQLQDFVQVLEVTLPSLFHGALDHYKTSNKSHLRRTAQKLAPSPETIARIQDSKVWKMENELYQFALDQFTQVRRRVLGATMDRDQRFMYEKIRPK